MKDQVSASAQAPPAGLVLDGWWLELASVTIDPMQGSPGKYDLFGVQVSATSYEEVVRFVTAAAAHNRPAILSFFAVHGLVSAASDPTLKERANSFDIIAPDGQPVRWALNWLHGVGLSERVYGPEAMLRVCQQAATEKIPVYLYGGTPESVRQLERNLGQRFPDLIIAGSESPPFRPLTPAEDAEVCDRINRSGAGIVFVGIGCPKQENFAFEHRDRIHAVQLCVGAAFDFHAGRVQMAPPWMQERGLEWLFRLTRDPKRLWRRYLGTNSRFLLKLLRARLQGTAGKLRRQQ